MPLKNAHLECVWATCIRVLVSLSKLLRITPQLSSWKKLAFRRVTVSHDPSPWKKYTVYVIYIYIYIYISAQALFPSFSTQGLCMWFERVLGAISLLREASVSLACPFHCGTSLLPPFCLGLLCGLLLGIVLAIYFVHLLQLGILHQPPSVSPVKPERRPQHRLLGYLHERRPSWTAHCCHWQVDHCHWGFDPCHCPQIRTFRSGTFIFTSNKTRCNCVGRAGSCPISGPFCWGNSQAEVPRCWRGATWASILLLRSLLDRLSNKPPGVENRAKSAYCAGYWAKQAIDTHTPYRPRVLPKGLKNHHWIVLRSTFGEPFRTHSKKDVALICDVSHPDFLCEPFESVAEVEAFCLGALRNIPCSRTCSSANWGGLDVEKIARC